jgi:hypothetical protein
MLTPPPLKVLCLQPNGYASVSDVVSCDVCLARLDRMADCLKFSSGTGSGAGKVKWRRVIIDEAQFLKNDVGKLAKTVANLDASHRWMMSGTPLTHRLEDLQGELSLLRVWPFTHGKGADAGWQDHL